MRAPAHLPDAASANAAHVVDESLDHYTRLLRRLLRVPAAVVTTIEAEHQIFAGVVGLKEPYQSDRRTPLTHSFCQYVVSDERPLVVDDARAVPRLMDNRAITDLDLHDDDGRTIGSLAAIDSQPRTWTDDELGVLEDLALACSVELRQWRRMVRDSEQLARTIFSSVDVAMAFYDTGNRLVLANELAERAAELAGFRLDQPPHAGVDVRLADNRTLVPMEAQVIPRALRGDLSHHEMEWFGPPGHQVALVARSQRLSRADGTPWGTLVAAHDVTELARALRVKDDFITTISHELRTPLASLLGYVELLADELDEAEGPVASTLATIDRAAKRLQSRIAELLDVADRRRRLDLRSVDLSEVVEQAVSAVAERATAAGVGLSVTAGQPQWAVVDEARVRQAVENLLSNAVKFIGRGGSVRVLVEGRAEEVAIAVTDDGIGMSADEVAQACDRFWRADGAHQAAVQGLGIGLTLVREIADAHQGSIDITSRPDAGTTATLTLPRSSITQM